MNSPFEVFRRHQKMAMVVLVFMAMFAFVVLGSVQHLGELPPAVKALCLGGLLGGVFWFLGAQKGQPKEYALLGAIIGTAAGFIGQRLNSPAAAVDTRVGRLTHNDLRVQIANRRIANEFIRGADEKLRANYAKLNPGVTPSPFDRSIGVSDFYSFGLFRQFDIFGRAHFVRPLEEDVVMTYIFRHEADRLGVSVSQDAVTKYIRDATSNQLSQADFYAILRAMGVGESRLYDVIADELKARIAFDLLRPRPFVTPEQYWDYYKKLNFKQRLDLTAIPVSAFAAEAPNPSDGELQEFFSRYAGRFPTGEVSPEPAFGHPRRVKFAWLAADYAIAEAKVAPEVDNQIDAARAKGEPTLVDEYYEANKDALYRNRDIPDDVKPPETKPFGPDLGLPGLGLPNSPLFPDNKTEPGTPPADKPPAKEPPVDKPAETKPTDEKPDPAKPDGDKKPESEPKSEDKPKPSDKDAGDEKKPAEPKKPASEKDGGEAADKKAGGTFSVKDVILAQADDTPKREQPPKADPPKADAPKADAPKTDPAKPEASAETNSAAEGEKPPAKPEALPGEEPATAEVPGEPLPASEPLPEFRPLDEKLREEIREKLIEERALKLLEKRIELAEAEVAKRANDFFALPDPKSGNPKVTPAEFAEGLRAWAEKNNLKYAESQLLTYQELLENDDMDVARAVEPAGPQSQRRTVARLLYETPTDQKYIVATASDIDRNRYVFWKLEDHERVEAKLADPGMKEKATEAWKLAKGREPAKKRAEDLAAMITKSGGKDFVDVLGMQTVTGKPEGQQLTIRETEVFSWLRRSSVMPTNFMAMSPPPELSTITSVEKAGNDFFETVFEKMKEGDVGVVANADQSIYYVVKVKDRVPSNDGQEEAMRKEFLARRDEMFSGSSPYSYLIQQDFQGVSSRWLAEIETRYEIDWTNLRSRRGEESTE